MEYVINCAFGGFQLPDEVINIPNFSELTSRETSNDIRTNPILIIFLPPEVEDDT